MPESIKQYLITGGNGQLGMELVRQLGEDCTIAKPREVFDVADFERVRDVVPLLRPAAVIHTAAVTDWPTAERERRECWRTNVLGTDNLVKVCAMNGIPMVHISCASVFGSNEDERPRTETDPVNPCHYLSSTKAAAEHAILRLGQCFCPEFWKKGFRYWVIRTGMLFERPWRPYNNTANRIMSLATSRRGEDVPLASDMILSPTYAPHLAEAIIWLVKHYREMPSGVYHVANREAASMHQFGQELALNCKKQIRVSPSSRAAMAQAFGGWDPALLSKNVALDCSKFCDVVPFSIPSWGEGVEQYAFEYGA